MKVVVEQMHLAPKHLKQLCTRAAFEPCSLGGSDISGLRVWVSGFGH
jgi:hypothetical protein